MSIALKLASLPSSSKSHTWFDVLAYVHSFFAWHLLGRDSKNYIPTLKLNKSDVVQCPSTFKHMWPQLLLKSYLNIIIEFSSMRFLKFYCLHCKHMQTNSMMNSHLNEILEVKLPTIKHIQSQNEWSLCSNPTCLKFFKPNCLHVNTFKHVWVHSITCKDSFLNDILYQPCLVSKKSTIM